jgi:hypothetical protein
MARLVSQQLAELFVAVERREPSAAQNQLKPLPDDELEIGSPLHEARAF